MARSWSFPQRGRTSRTFFAWKPIETSSMTFFTNDWAASSESPLDRRAASRSSGEKARSPG